MTAPEQPAPPSAPPQRTTLPRELGEFLIEFSIAINKFAMYPGGHPSLTPAVEGMVRRLDQLLADRGTLSVGVARQQLVIEGVATDTSNPVLKELAGRLHRHHLGAVTFSKGIEVDELVEFVSKVAVEADRSEQPLGLVISRLAAWPHVRMYPLMYDRLELLDESGQEQVRSDDPAARTQRTRAAQLWVGMARAALAAGGREATPRAAETPAEPEVATDPASVARAIESNPRGTAYDQVIVGYMLQIAEELRSAGGAEAAQLKKRMSRLVSTLDPGTLERLLDMGGDGIQRRQFLLNASQGMAVDAVLDLVNAASNTEQQTISHSMLRMLQKLARHADGGSGDRRVVAEQSVREQVAELISSWSLKDPNPGGYARALEALSGTNPIFAVSAEALYAAEPRRIVQMAIEVEVVGEPVDRAVAALVERGQLPWLVETLTATPGSAVTSAIWALVATDAHLATVLQSDPLDTALVDLLVSRIGSSSAPVLLDALMELGSAQSRRFLLDRIVALGPEIVPAVVSRLADERWYVKRNMLRILGDLDPPPPDVPGHEYLTHEDARVRREALRLVLKNPSQRERAICRALTDPDDRMVRLALSAALQSCPAAACSLVASRALSGPDQDQRVLAIRVLGASGMRTAVDPLLRLTQPRRSFFGSRPPPKTPEYVAAIVALRGFAEDPRAREILDQAARSRDAEIAEAATGAAP